MMSVRERTFWFDLIDWRYEFMKWKQSQEEDSGVRQLGTAWE
jgi:DnaJ-domain-containing protein 1